MRADAQLVAVGAEEGVGDESVRASRVACSSVVYQITQDTEVANSAKLCFILLSDVVFCCRIWRGSRMMIPTHLTIIL